MNKSVKRNPLDFDDLLNRCLGEVDFARRILSDFLKTTRPLLDEIGNALFDSAEEKAAFQVHRLKGTAGLVAANSLLDSLVELETLLRRTSDTTTHAQISGCLNQSYQRFDEVQKFAERNLLNRPQAELSS